jgi:predicted dehydrogenase
LAETNGQVAFDIMTERYEITSIVARELVADGAVFGNPVAGSADQPGVFMESIHHIMKQVAGVASLRPLSFFDIEEQGEGLSDVGTHLVDLVQWTLFPNQAIDYRTQIEMLAAKRWPTLLTPAEFTRVTGVSEIPARLRRWATPEGFAYYCNNLVAYKLRGVHVKLNVLWNYEAPPGAGDVYEAVFRGTRSQIEIRQGERENYRPELYITPATSDDRSALARALEFRIGEVARRYPGIRVQDSGARFHIIIPAEHRTSHEMHFAEVTREFFTYLASPKSLPRWEKPNMLAKYWITTRGVEMSRQENR